MSDSVEELLNNFPHELPASMKVAALDEAVNATPDIEMEMQSTINELRNLSLKHEKPTKNYLHSLSPTSDWKTTEYLSFNVDPMMNENCQKHDLDSPQQHHKMQEINDDSSSSASSTPSGSIINHTPSEVNSECSFAMGDGVWQTRQSDTEPQV